MPVRDAAEGAAAQWVRRGVPMIALTVESLPLSSISQDRTYRVVLFASFYEIVPFPAQACGRGSGVRRDCGRHQGGAKGGVHHGVVGLP